MANDCAFCGFPFVVSFSSERTLNKVRKCVEQHHVKRKISSCFVVVVCSVLGWKFFADGWCFWPLLYKLREWSCTGVYAWCANTQHRGPRGLGADHKVGKKTTTLLEEWELQNFQLEENPRPALYFLELS